MPNTLAHLGVQGVVTRAVVRGADPKWVYLGAIIPDIPSILQRAVRAFVPGVDPIGLRSYAVAQSSLMSCLLLCCALATLSRQPKRILLVLSLNSLLHLLFDALETKWGNGVNIIAPFSWDPWNLGLFWPDSWLAHLLAAWGLVYVLVLWTRRSGIGVGVRWPHARGLLVAAATLTLYLVLPLSATPGVKAADAHSIATVERPCVDCGVAFDRVRYHAGPVEDSLHIWAKRSYAVRGERLDHSATVSVRGVFRDSVTVEIDHLHEHRGLSRDLPSYLGLLLVLLIWLRARPSSRPDRSGAVAD